MFKKVAKNTLWVALILTLGQIPIGEKTIGRYFIEGIGHSFVWTGHSVLTTPWMAGMDHPEWLDSLFEVDRNHKPKRDRSVNLEHLSPREREQVKKLLE